MIKLLKIENNSMFILLDDKQVKTTLNIPDLGFKSELNFNNGELYIDGKEVVDIALKGTVEKYIDDFDFPSNSVHGLQNCVDSNLNYLGFIDNTESEFTEVLKVPSLKIESSFWYKGSFVDGCLVDVTTKKYRGVGVADGVEAEYAPVIDLPTSLDPFLYSYIDLTWTVNLAEAKDFYRVKFEDEIHYTSGSITDDELVTLNDKKDGIMSATTLDTIIINIGD